MLKCLAIIPARKNSIGLKNKNKVSFSGYLLRKEIFTIQKNHSKFEKKDLSILIIGGMLFILFKSYSGLQFNRRESSLKIKKNFHEFNNAWKIK